MDVLLAVCALLISSLAMTASWLQSRESARQTQVLQDQLSAQVWPYVGVSSSIAGDTVTVAIENDGLGPAVLRSLIVNVDGKSRSDFVKVLQLMLGPAVMKHGLQSSSQRVNISSISPGSVLRPGNSIGLMSYTSKRYASRLVGGFSRMNIRICYCAIIPGKCWQQNTVANQPPKPVDDCPEISDDLLHANMLDVMKRL